MSLLMEALKKAEQAKRKAADGIAAPASPSQLTPESTPPPAMKLELTPTEPAPSRIEPVYATEPPPVAPPPQEPKFTTIAERVPQVAEPVKPAKPEPQAESAPFAKPVIAPPPKVPIAMAPVMKPQNTVATAPPKSNAAPRAMLWPMLGVGVVLMMGGGGYWYYNSMSAFLLQQTTQGVPQTAMQAEAPVVELTPAPAPVTAGANPVVAPAKNSITKTPRKPDALVPVPPPVVPATAALPVPAAPPPINVSRHVDQTEMFNYLQQAYRHYQNGDDVRAQVLYARVLDHEEHNRDALLGIAAIAVRQRDTLKAQEIYSELLALDPRDTVAQAGFVGVTRSLDPLQQEARVKQLLEQEPNAPHLLFTYATFLMQQQRWSEASRVLLSAYQSQRDNADYAFNLAVTLDHLGQNDNALKFYRAALDLTSTQAASFRADDVRRRIATLQAAREGGTP